jgi:hypothetical protein
MPRNTEGGGMTDPLPITIRTFGLCQECGAVVHDEAKHFEWHADQLPDDLPEQVSDPWEEALADTDVPRRGWDWHLASALRNCAGALDTGEDDAGYFRGCLALAAAHIHAMAPEGTEWHGPWIPTDARAGLREVLRRLVNADAHRQGENDREAVLLLCSAEASLHGLWLAAKEGGNG